MSVVDMVVLILKLIVAALQLLEAVLKYAKTFRFKPHLREAGNRFNAPGKKLPEGNDACAAGGGRSTV